MRAVATRGAAAQTKRRLRQAGVSLIEALVAMTVVGIGMVSLVGVQASLRANSDVSKQRSEAVRLGQTAIEDWRAFTTMVEYNGFVDLNDAPVDVGNASYTVARVVEDAPAPLRGKALAVAVSWQDRTDTPQTVRLNTFLTGISPELGASLSLAPTGGKTRGPGSRSQVIPRQATDLQDGTSALRPDGGNDTVWRFRNLTGEIQLCTLVDSGGGLVASNLTGCSGRYLLYSGFVRYSLDSSQPGPAEALSPSGPIDTNIEWSLLSTATATNSDGLCFQESATGADAVDNTRVFYCAVRLITPVGATSPTLAWSGRLVFGPAGDIATTVTDADDTRRRICRYPQTVYPLDDIRQPQINQNYLVIKAGDGSSPAFACPDGTTIHQPAP